MRKGMKMIWFTFCPHHFASRLAEQLRRVRTWSTPNGYKVSHCAFLLLTYYLMATAAVKRVRYKKGKYFNWLASNIRSPAERRRSWFFAIYMQIYLASPFFYYTKLFLPSIFIKACLYFIFLLLNYCEKCLSLYHIYLFI